MKIKTECIHIKREEKITRDGGEIEITTARFSGTHGDQKTKFSLSTLAQDWEDEFGELRISLGSKLVMDLQNPQTKLETD